MEDLNRIEELYRRIKNYLINAEPAFILEKAHWQNVHFSNIPLNEEVLVRDTHNNIALTQLLVKEAIDGGIYNYTFANDDVLDMATIVQWISMEEFLRVIEIRFTLLSIS